MLAVVVSLSNLLYANIIKIFTILKNIICRLGMYAINGVKTQNCHSDLSHVKVTKFAKFDIKLTHLFFFGSGRKRFQLI